MGLDTTGGHPSMDYAEHRRAYSGFLRFVQIMVVLVALILVGMFYFLV